MTQRTPPDPVYAPRPAAAWLMALVASAALWITGELSPWIIPIQLIAYAVSYATRADPPRWRRSPVWLNVGMFGITAVTIAAALSGHPSTLSLAYFSGLSQGLQLLDARPRKSEFLLVALALFQVILAANLTDSVFFPPLLLIFLLSVSWTLIAQTLRTEAAEAGDIRATHARLTAGLARTTLISSAVSILLGLVIFTMLPRLRTHMLRGNGMATRAVSGFSDHVSLGTIGRIRADDTVVLRVETLSGEPPAAIDAYWRGLAFDRFDGRSWSISSDAGLLHRRHVNGSPRFGVDLRGGPDDAALVQRIVREPVEAGVLFSAGFVRRIEGPMDRIQLDPTGGLYYPTRPDDRVRYTLWTQPPGWSEEALRSDHTAVPKEFGPGATRRLRRYLDLPQLDRRVTELARSVTETQSNDADRVRAIERHLRQHGRYTDSPPPMGEIGLRSPVEDFLLDELSGHCEYFASGMVVLTRSLGIPSRLVNGFAGGRRNRIGGFTTLTRSDAHAWVEVHYADAGWVRYDPTPPDLRMRAAGVRSLGERMAELASVLELWWFQQVVDFDTADQILALKSTWRFFRNLRSDDVGPSTTTARKHADWDAPLDGRTLAIGLGAAALALIALLGWRSQTRRRDDPVPAPYRAALRALARRGHVRSPAKTARAFAAEVRAALPREASTSFERITEAYLAERFGADRPASAGDLADLSTLKLGLRRPFRAPRTRDASAESAARRDAGTRRDAAT
jgi:transglutaminase-like putative cysteine protease